MLQIVPENIFEGIPKSLEMGILLLIPLLSAVLLYFVVIKTIRLFTKKDRFLKKEYVVQLRLPFILILFLLVFMQEIDVIGADYKYLDKMVQIGWILSIAVLLIRLTVVGRLVLLSQYNIEERDNVKARKVVTQIRVFERVIYVLIIVLAVGLSLMTFDSIRKIGISILTSAGIAGIIIGLAAQKLIGNLLAGMQIAITQPIRLEDVVLVEGDFGWVEEINLTYVVVRVWDRRRVVLPATYFIERPFQNWTRTKSDIMGTVMFYLDYGAPVELMRQKLLEFAGESEYWDGDVCNVQVTDLTEKTMVIRGLVSARSAPEAWDLRVYLRERMIKFLQDEYPQYLPKLRIEERTGEK